MAGGERALTFAIKTKDEQALAALKRVQKELKDTDKAAGRAKSGMSGFGSALGGLAVGAGIGMAISEFEEAEKVGRQTEAVIKSTGAAAGITADQVSEMAGKMSKLAAVDDEVIAQGANVLLTFTNIKGTETFEPALQAALDMSAALGTELQPQVMAIGKALNDPIKGVSKLTKVGVTFTEQQKDQIKTMAEAGDVAGAQAVILAELQREFGGAAEANATSTARMKVAAGNMAESVGQVLAPALEKAATLAEDAAGALSAMPPEAQAAVLALGGLASVGPRVADALDGITSSTGGVRGALKASVSDIGGLNSTLAAGVAGIAAYSLTMNALEESVKFRGDLQGLAKDLQDLTDTSINVNTALTEVGGVKQLAADIDELGYATLSTMEQIRKSGVGFKLWQNAADFQSAQNRIEALDGALRDMVRNGNVGEARKAYGEIARELIKMGVATDDVVKAFPEYLTEIERAGRGTNDLASAGAASADAGNENADAWKDAAKAFGDAEKSLSDLTDAALDSFDAVTSVSNAEIALREAIVQRVQALHDKDPANDEKAYNDMRGAVSAYIKAKVDQARADAEARGKTLSAGEAIDVQRAAIEQLKAKYPELRKVLDEIIVRMYDVSQKREAQLDTQAAIDAGKRLLDVLRQVQEVRLALTTNEGLASLGPHASPGMQNAERGGRSRRPGAKTGAIVHINNAYIGGRRGSRDLEMEGRNIARRVLAS